VSPDDLEQRVHDLYASYPYPAHGVLGSVVALMLEPPLRELQARRGSRQLRYLDAGCGTGEQTLGVARRFPELEVTGVDFNEASLSFARELARRHGIRATFRHANLMKPLADLGDFDVISSVGVLHSLAQPATGFENLRRVARPHAVLLGMVYGTFGKWELFQVRDAVSLIAGAAASREERLALLRESRLAGNEGLRHYAATLLTRLRFGPRIRVAEAVRRVLGGRSKAYQADAYTHVREVTYTWGELIDLLTRTGWRFVGWPARSGMPDRPEQLFRGEALRRARGMPPAELAAIYERLVRPPNLYFLAVAAG